MIALRLKKIFDHHPLWLLSFLWLASAVFVNPIGDFPLNDDWQYAYPVKQLLEQGEIAFTGRFAPNIFLQIAWGYLWCLPFGEFSFSVLRISTLTVGLVGGFLVFKTGKLLGLNQKFSFFISGCLLFNPLYFNLSFTFMTDVPFLVLVLASLYFFLRYEKMQSTGALVGALAFAAGSFLVRQPGILLLPLYAVWLFFPIPGQSEKKWVTPAILLFTGLLYLAIEQWVKPRLGLAENYVPVSHIFLDEMLGNPVSFVFEQAKRVLKTLIYLGFFSLPLAPLLWKKVKSAGLLRLRLILPVLLGNILLLGLLIYTRKTFPFGGNVLFNLGLGPELLFDRYELDLPHTPQWPEAAMYLLQLLGQLWLTFMLLLTFRAGFSVKSPEGRFFLLLFFLNVAYLFLMSIFSYFDRYLLLPVVSLFFFLAWLAKDIPRLNYSHLIPLLIFGLFSLFATTDYLNWNRARAQAFNFLQAGGVSIKKMDAGYEYMGWYNYQPDFPDHPERSYWWVEDDTYLITFGLVEEYEVVKRFWYRSWLSWKKEAIMVLRKVE